MELVVFVCVHAPPVILCIFQFHVMVGGLVCLCVYAHNVRKLYEDHFINRHKYLSSH